MSSHPAGRPDADRNLLFGVLAFQLAFINRNALVRGLNDCARDKAKTLGQVLLEQGVLRADAHLLLESLVQKHLELHNGDPRRSLTAFRSHESAGEPLLDLTDLDLQSRRAEEPTNPQTSAGPATDPDQSGAPVGGSADPFATSASLTAPDSPAARPRESFDSFATVAPPTNPVRPAPDTGESTDVFATAAPVETGNPSSFDSTSTFSVLRYRVLRPHARGGLGEVFIAHDVELGREVALKEIQSRHADHPQARARFLLEGEITGNLEHPGIVPVYGLGTYADGRPYYAMRFIHGESLHSAIDAFHEADKSGRDPGRRTLELRRLLGRFVDVCNAISYAHSRGVLHRDIKPDNVMLGPHGETLVVDWGLAKPHSGDDTPANLPLTPSGSGQVIDTQMGQTIGTPAFMSPEQAAGRLDQLGPPSDVYSLGATLYCLLTGQPPFTDQDIKVLLGKVRRGDFPPPRQVNRRVPPALEAVCLKAMAVQAGDRYPTAQVLANDLEHWLADEPVSVYREPIAARLARWARRHRTQVVGLVVLLASAVPGLTLTTVLVTREQRRTADQRRQAEANFQTALQAVDSMLTEVAQDQLVPEPRMEKKRRALLAKARTYYEQFLEQRGDDLGLRKEAALAHKRLGDISRLLGEYDQARESYTQAITPLTSLAAAHPDEPEYRFQLGLCYDDLAEVWRRTSHPEEAREAYGQALELQEQLVKEAPDNPEYRKELARTHDNLGIFLKDTKRPKEAEAALKRAVKLFRQLAADYPRNPEYRQHLARASLNLGPVLRAAGQARQAEDAYREAIRLQTALVDGDPLTPDYRYELGVSLRNLGYLFETTRRYAEAEEVLRQAVDRFTRLALDFPGIPVYQTELAGTENILGIVLARDHQWSAAEAAWSRALALQEKLAKEHPDAPDYQGHRGLALENLGWLLLQQKDLPEIAAGLFAGRVFRTQLLMKACQRLEQAMELTMAALKPNPNNPTFLQGLRDQTEYLAQARTDLGEHARAAELARKLPTIIPSSGQDSFVAAGLLAQCMILTKNDLALSEDRRKALSLEYADQAVAFIRQGIARGCKDAERLTRPPFTALWGRADFQRLLAQVKAGTAPGGR